MAYIINVEDKKYKAEIHKDGDIFKVLLDGREFQVEVAYQDREKFTLIIEHKPHQVFVDADDQLIIEGETYRFDIRDERSAKLAKAGAEVSHKEITISAPMPGLIVDVEVKEGEAVPAGRGLVILEAMKMQNELKAPKAGVVKAVKVKPGEKVNGGDVLIVLQ